MQLAELSSADKESYNRFVAQAPSGSFLQSWDWGQWQAAQGRQPIRYKIVDDSGETTAVIQLIKMPLPFGRFYLYAPYGPVVSGQWAVGSGQLLQELRKKFADAVFVRVEPKDTVLSTTHYPLLTKSSNIQPGKTLLIDLTKSEQQLLAEMHPKTRYNIKVAQKYGVEIKDEFDISVGHGLFAKEAIGLIAQTAQRQGFKDYGSGYYHKIINFFTVSNRGDLKLHIYKAIYQNQILASAVMVDFPAEGGSASGGGTRTFLFGGSSDEHRNVMAPYLLHWQAMRDAKVGGMVAYDFWGTETASGEIPGFVRFKLGFGGQEKTFAGAYDIIIKKALYRAYGWFRVINKMVKKISLG
jgi:lipid II:glycine glycyltransferase (peptidoglycan interpeptide bridge formation enzyme)